MLPAGIQQVLGDGRTSGGTAQACILKPTTPGSATLQGVACRGSLALSVLPCQSPAIHALPPCRWWLVCGALPCHSCPVIAQPFMRCHPAGGGRRWAAPAQPGSAGMAGSPLAGSHPRGPLLPAAVFAYLSCNLLSALLTCSCSAYLSCVLLGALLICSCLPISHVSCLVLC